jgi:hypothetical protein
VLALTAVVNCFKNSKLWAVTGDVSKINFTTRGLYNKHVAIVNDDTIVVRMMLQVVALHLEYSE